MSDDKLGDLCSNCGAACCRYVSLEIDKPTCSDDYEHIRWYLLHQDVNVYVDSDGGWCIEFKALCRNLDTNNMCKDYSNRPKICREHGADGNCERTAEHPDELYRHFFSCVGEFDEYLKNRRNGQKRKKGKCRELQCV